MLLVLQEVLKQLQSKLEQEAGTLASSGRSDVLHQLKGPSLLQRKALIILRGLGLGKEGMKEGSREGGTGGGKEVR